MALSISYITILNFLQKSLIFLSYFLNIKKLEEPQHINSFLIKKMLKSINVTVPF